MPSIVVGIDGSPASVRALHWAVEEARLRGATVRVVHAWSFPYHSGEIAHRAAESVHELLRKAAEETVETALHGVTDADRAVIECVIVQAPPVQAAAWAMPGAPCTYAPQQGDCNMNPANPSSSQELTCDLLVVGSGAGGLSTAIAARKHGLDVIVLEKATCFGGTTAFSGGVLWIPGNTQCAAPDTREAMRTYMKDQTGPFYQADAVDAFLDHAPEMVAWFERETAVRFVPTLYPDYHPDAPGGAAIGRSILAAPYDASQLGPELARLRPPLSTITFVGMMFNSSNADLKHFFRATKSVVSAAYVARRLGGHLLDLLRYRRGVQVTSGNALAARLAKTCFDLVIPIHTEAEARE